MKEDLGKVRQLQIYLLPHTNKVGQPISHNAVSDKMAAAPLPSCPSPTSLCGLTYRKHKKGNSGNCSSALPRRHLMKPPQIDTRSLCLLFLCNSSLENDFSALKWFKSLQNKDSLLTSVYHSQTKIIVAFKSDLDIQKSQLNSQCLRRPVLRALVEGNLLCQEESSPFYTHACMCMCIHTLTHYSS